MTSLQLQARALGDPTRYAIFRHVADGAGPIGVAELTSHMGLHHNAIRQHLARLVAAELVIESTSAPTGRGRPRLVYEAAPSTDSRWGVTGPYERLSVLLSEIVRTGDDPVDVGRRAGSDGDSPVKGRDPAAVMADRMARLGFAPERAEVGDTVDLVLHNCPYETAAAADPDTVCGLHLGLAHGVAESIGGIVVDTLVRRDPHTARCLLRCHLDESAADRPDGTSSSAGPPSTTGGGSRLGGRM